MKREIVLGLNLKEKNCWIELDYLEFARSIFFDTKQKQDILKKCQF